MVGRTGRTGRDGVDKTDGTGWTGRDGFKQLIDLSNIFVTFDIDHVPTMSPTSFQTPYRIPTHFLKIWDHLQMARRQL